jgi:hypothetical protein
MCRTALVGSINGWCARAISLAVVLKRWPFTCYWSRWDAEGLSYYSDKTAARLLSLNEAQLREARHSLLAAGLIAYESPLYQVLSLEPTSTSEPPVVRTGQTLPISAILRQMLETGGMQQQQQPPPSP